MASHGLPRVAKEGDVEKERRKIAEYRDLVELVTTKINEKQYTIDVLELTAKLLGKNPEYYTIWNYRRRILSHLFAEHSDPEPRAASNFERITNDLKFLIPLLQEFPKCYWLWNYRRWLLEQAEVVLAREQAVQIWQKELGLVSMMLSKDGRNFHGWGYRKYVIAELERLTGSSMVEDEFAYTEKMIKAALQNFSALHYRSKLIPRLLDERKADGQARRKMLEDEFNLMQEALIDPYNQSPWFYHQFLMSTLAAHVLRESAIVLDLTDTDRIGYYEQEIERIREILEDFDGCKWVYEALLRYSVELAALNGGLEQASTAQFRDWLSRLRRLDPFRSGRWNDLQAELKL